MVSKKQYYKNYYLLNNETIKLQIRQNYINNKDRINRKIQCECGRIVIHRMLKKHLETNIHKKLLLEVSTVETKHNDIKIDTSVNNDGWIHFK